MVVQMSLRERSIYELATVKQPSIVGECLAHGEMAMGRATRMH